MWLFTKYGFFSVVRSALNQTDMMIRARKREHLVNLQSTYLTTLGQYKIRSSRDTDYKYRLIVPKYEIKWLMTSLAKELNYCNFKDEAKKLHDPDYSKALGDVWERMLELQESNASTLTRPRPSAQSSGRAGSGGVGTRSEGSS